MRFQRACTIVSVTLLLAVGPAICADEDASTYAEKPIPTYVGPIEKMILTIGKPFEIIGDSLKGVGDGVGDILDKIPGVKGTKKTGGSAIKSMADILNPFKDKIRAIYPGTKWCGDGDVAKNEEDLGFFKATDACCRAHDSCVGGIPAQKEDHGLWNGGIFTRSPCPCDADFYRCLKEAKNIVATEIGTTYFNVLRPQCFKLEFPIKNCKKYSKARPIDDKCEEYNLDETATPKYQWFDNPDFFQL